MLVRCDLSWEKSHATAVDGVTGPSVVRLDAADNNAGRSQVAVALSAVVGCDRVTVPVSGASCRGPGVDGLEALHVTWAIVEEWRWIATRDDSKLGALANAVNLSVFRRLLGG